MEKHKKILMFLVVLSFIICSEVVIVEVNSSRNGPNYWGKGFPGHFISPDNYYQNPTKPEFYIFQGIPDPVANDYDGSHYGTHDWLSDAALRSLKNHVKNPLHSRDWSWLLNYECLINKNPQWNYDYSISTDTHNVVRSYITFLFATQMPDMKPEKYPDIQSIEIPAEGEIITNIENLGNLGKWVGDIDQHKYSFSPELNPNTELYEFYPQITEAAAIAEILGGQAIKAIGATIENEDGEKVSAMKPETAAGWLGAMSHYFGDVCLPAHVLYTTPEVYGGAFYHIWFENNLAALTLWDTGPYIFYFNYDFDEIIIPLPPSIAIAELARKSIEIAYRFDGNHQVVKAEPNSGLFISDYNPLGFWDWEDNIDHENGRSYNELGYFYDKVQQLIHLSVYYTACAMQYCYEEGKKKANDDLNPDYYSENPRDITLEPPITDPSSDRDDLSDSGAGDRYTSKIAKKFNNMSRLISSIILIGIPYALQRTLSLNF